MKKWIDMYCRHLWGLPCPLLQQGSSTSALLTLRAARFDGVAALYTAECLAVSLVSTHQMPLVQPQSEQPTTSAETAKHPWGKKWLPAENPWFIRWVYMCWGKKPFLKQLLSILLDYNGPSSWVFTVLFIDVLHDSWFRCHFSSCTFPDTSFINKVNSHYFLSLSIIHPLLGKCPSLVVLIQAEV